MSNLDKILFSIQSYAEKNYTGTPLVMFLDLKLINKFNDEEKKKIWLWAKVRFITIHIMDNKDLRVYELQQDGKLVLIWKQLK